MFPCTSSAQALIKCVLHQVHDALGHNGPYGTYQHVNVCSY